MQDRVPAFSAEKAMAFIEKELGAPVNELFADFERQPIAAASLGQVESFSNVRKLKNSATSKSIESFWRVLNCLLELIFYPQISANFGAILRLFHVVSSSGIFPWAFLFTRTHLLLMFCVCRYTEQFCPMERESWLKFRDRA